jgi:hypothetical protein
VTPTLRFDTEGKADKIAGFVDATSPSRSQSPEGRGGDAASTGASLIREEHLRGQPRGLGPDFTERRARLERQLDATC